MIRNLVLTAAAAALVAAPVAAQAAPVRAPAPVADSEELGGGLLVPVLVFAAVSALFLIIYSGDDDEDAVSP
jgi:hypothetical protein